MDATLVEGRIEHEPERPAPPPERPLEWIAPVDVLEDLDIWRSVTRMLAIAALSLGVLLGAVAKSLMVLVTGSVASFVVLMVVYVVFALVIDFTGGAPEHFALTPRGIRCGASPDVVRIPYREVTRVDVVPLRRHVRVEGGPLNRPIGLYCTEDNFAQVVAVLRERCRGARFVDVP